MERYGWFEYEHNPTRITNYLTGQSLSVTQQRKKVNTSEFQALYSDGEIERKVEFSITQNEKSIDRIVLDYSVSFQEPPIHWQWRRLDDFITDALLCWPDYLEHGGGFDLTVKGAWISGVWRLDILRQFSGRKSGKPEQLTNYLVSDPYVTSADIPQSQAWKLIDVDNPKAESKFLFNFIDDKNIPFLARSSSIEGFQGDVPYLRREDGKAYIVFSKLQSSSYRDEEPQTHLYYTYIDEDIFFKFRSHPFYKNELSPAIDYGFREFPPQREFWTVKPLGELVQGDSLRSKDSSMSKFSYLSYPVWLRVLHALGDAWPAWGTPKKIELTSPENIPSNYGKVGCIGNYGPTTSHGYCAGMVNSWYQVRYLDA